MQRGAILYYVVEWPDSWEVMRDHDHWPGAVTLVAKISAHAAQICALVWSPNGRQFATGGDDDLCCLFETDKMVQPVVRQRCDSSATIIRHDESYDAIPEIRYDVGETADGAVLRTALLSSGAVPQFEARHAKHR